MADSVLKITVDKAAKALGKVKNNPKKLALASLCDMLFFVVYGFIAGPLLNKIVDYVIVIGTVISENAASLTRGESTTIEAIIMADPQARQLFNSLILIYIILAFTVYIIYTFFHSVSWKLSSDIAGRKIGMYDFMKEFALLNIFWMVLFSIQHLLSLFSDLREAAMKGMQVESSTSFGIFVAALLFAICYFALISYTFIGKRTTKEKIKKSFYLGIKKINHYIPAFAVMAVVYFVLQCLLELAARVNFNLMLVVGIITVIPAMTWARVYITLITEKAK